jgi:hypothetical protein
MSTLTSKQLKQYNEDGYIAPIDILSLEKIKKNLGLAGILQVSKSKE